MSASIDGKRDEKNMPRERGAYKKNIYLGVSRSEGAEMYLGEVIATREPVCIKILDFEKYPNSFEESVRSSVASLIRNLEHPNILPHYVSFTEGTELWVVDAPAVCSVEAILHQTKGLDEPIVRAILYQILAAIVHFHSLSIIHRDIRARHILLNAEGRAMLTYLSKVKDLQSEGTNRRAMTTFGLESLLWTAPEAAPGREGQGYALPADIWSFGITALEMAKGEAPYAREENPMLVNQLLLDGAAPAYPEKLGFSDGFKEMVTQCLNVDPSKRPTAKKLLEGSYFKKEGKKNSKIKCTEMVANYLRQVSASDLLKQRVEQIPKEEEEDPASSEEDEEFDFNTPELPPDSPEETSNGDNKERDGSPPKQPAANRSPQSSPQKTEVKTNATPAAAATIIATPSPATATTTTTAANPLPTDPSQPSPSPTPEPSQTPTATSEPEKPVFYTTPGAVTIPVETYLGETSDEYHVFLRTLPSTTLHLKIRGNALVIKGELPLLPSVPGVTLLQAQIRDFEHLVEFPTDIDPENTSRETIKRTMIIKVKKLITRDLGTAVM